MVITETMICLKVTGTTLEMFSVMKLVIFVLTMYKSSNIKYCKLPSKVSKEIPLNKLLVDLIDNIDFKNLYISYS